MVSFSLANRLSFIPQEVIMKRERTLQVVLALLGLLADACRETRAAEPCHGKE